MGTGLPWKKNEASPWQVLATSWSRLFVHLKSTMWVAKQPELAVWRLLNMSCEDSMPWLTKASKYVPCVEPKLDECMTTSWQTALFAIQTGLECACHRSLRFVRILARRPRHRDPVLDYNLPNASTLGYRNVSGQLLGWNSSRDSDSLHCLQLGSPRRLRGLWLWLNADSVALNQQKWRKWVGRLRPRRSAGHVI